MYAKRIILSGALSVGTAVIRGKPNKFSGLMRGEVCPS